MVPSYLIPRTQDSWVWETVHSPSPALLTYVPAPSPAEHSPIFSLPFVPSAELSLSSLWLRSLTGPLNVDNS